MTKLILSALIINSLLSYSQDNEVRALDSFTGIYVTGRIDAILKKS